MSLIEKFITQWLPEANVNFLTDLCNQYAINIPDTKLGKHQEVLKLVLRYLSSETLENSADKGAAVFMKLFNELGVELGKGTPKAEPLDTGTVNNSTLSYHKLRELKINGTIDGGKDGTLTYTSLSCQLKQAEAAGYSTSEIIAAVIKSIPAGKSFRSLLESKVDLEKDDFMKLLRSHFKEKDSAAVLQLLMNCYQEPGQDAHEFCCMAMAFRDRVEALSEEEGNPEDPDVLTKRLYHTIFTGLKQNSVRMELHSDIKAANLSDVAFLEKVALAEANESERLGKVKVKAEIAALTESSSSSNTKKASSSGSPAASKQKSASHAQSASHAPENNVVLDKFDLLVTKIDSLTTFSQEQAKKVADLENKLQNQNTLSVPSFGNLSHSAFGNVVDNQRQNNNRNNGGRKIFKCAGCVTGNVSYCVHCFRCGSDQHKAAQCPEK